MAYNIDNVIVNLKKEIAEAGGASNPVVSFEVFDISHLLAQEGITISKTKTLTASAWLIVHIEGMASNVSFKINEVERLFIDGYIFKDHEIIPVYPGDVITLSVAADGNNDNFISSIILVSGIDVPTPTNSKQEDK